MTLRVESTRTPRLVRAMQCLSTENIMSVERLDAIVDREIRVRRRQFFYLLGFFAAMLVVIGALLRM